MVYQDVAVRPSARCDSQSVVAGQCHETRRLFAEVVVERSVVSQDAGFPDLQSQMFEVSQELLLLQPE